MSSLLLKKNYKRQGDWILEPVVVGGVCIVDFSESEWFLRKLYYFVNWFFDFLLYVPVHLKI